MFGMLCTVSNLNIGRLPRRHRLLAVCNRCTATRSIYVLDNQKMIAKIPQTKSSGSGSFPIKIAHFFEVFIQNHFCLGRGSDSSLLSGNNLQIKVTHLLIMDRITNRKHLVLTVQKESLKVHIRREMIQSIKTSLFIDKNRIKESISLQ